MPHTYEDAYKDFRTYIEQTVKGWFDSWVDASLKMGSHWYTRRDIRDMCLIVMADISNSPENTDEVYEGDKGSADTPEILLDQEAGASCIKEFGRSTSADPYKSDLLDIQKGLRIKLTAIQEKEDVGEEINLWGGENLTRNIIQADEVIRLINAISVVLDPERYNLPADEKNNNSWQQAIHHVYGPHSVHYPMNVDVRTLYTMSGIMATTPARKVRGEDWNLVLDTKRAAEEKGWEYTSLEARIIRSLSGNKAKAKNAPYP